MFDFIRRSAAFDIDGPEGVGRVSAGIFEDESGDVVAFAEWGGWVWTAWGLDSDDAIRRLESRLSRLSPFEGEDTDWGPSGCATGEPISYQVSEETRRDMEDVPVTLSDRAIGPFESQYAGRKQHVSVTWKGLTYYGTIHTATPTGGHHLSVPYLRDNDAVWRREGKGSPPKPLLAELLDFAEAEARNRGSSTLAARWGENGPEVIE